MREILFKAKSAEKNSENEFYHTWVEGNLIISGGKYFIHPLSNRVNVNGEIGKLIVMHEVQPETVCQYTGLLDKNGQKIWENDIAYMRCNGLSGYGRVVYENGCFWIDDKKRNRKYPFSNHDVKYRVDGNIFDNAEILERKE